MKPRSSGGSMTGRVADNADSGINKNMITVGINKDCIGDKIRRAAATLKMVSTTSAAVTVLTSKLWILASPLSHQH
jgi:hypothetical protein